MLLLAGATPHAAFASQGSTECAGFVLTPAPGARIEPDDLHFSWRPVEGVGSYRIEVARESDFVAASFRVEGMKKAEYAAKLPAGRYYWRVSAADGPFRGPTCEFSIVRITRTAYLLLTLGALGALGGGYVLLRRARASRPS